MNGFDDVWLRERQQIVTSLEVVRMPDEPVTSKSRLVQLVGLDHRPHGPVNKDDALGQKVGDRLCYRMIAHEQLENARSELANGSTIMNASWVSKDRPSAALTLSESKSSLKPPMILARL